MDHPRAQDDVLVAVLVAVLRMRLVTEFDTFTNRIFATVNTEFFDRGPLAICKAFVVLDDAFAATVSAALSGSRAGDG